MDSFERPMPHGTLRLEQMLDARHGEIILHPVPSTDPNDPLNWPASWKTVNFALVCFYTLMIFVAVDIGTVIWGDLNEDLGISFETEYVSFGVNCAGLAVGCVLLIPFALKYGRRVVYLVSIIVSIAAAIWSARMFTAGDLIGTNVLSGIAGATAETICQMTIADVFFVHQRGRLNAIYLLCVNFGAFLAPVAAGYCASSQGWRWIWWWTVILLGLCLILFIFLYEDTKFTPASDGLINVASEITNDGDADLQHKPSATVEVTTSAVRPIDYSMSRKPYWQRLRMLTTTPGWAPFVRHIYQPFVVLVTFPAVTYAAITYGSLLAWFSIAVTIYSSYFTLPPYNFTSSGVGLMNLPPFIGGLLGSVYGVLLVDRSIIWLSRRNKGVFEPEMRLWTALPGVLLMPGGLLWFGLSTAYGTHWIVPAIGLAVFGFGFVVMSDVALTYVMDCYQDIIGDAFIGIVFVRNVCATIIATTLTPWIDGLGLVNVIIMSTVFAFALSLLIVPMMVWGKQARMWTGTRLEAMTARQYVARRA